MSYKCKWCQGFYSSQSGLTNHVNKTCPGYKLELLRNNSKQSYVNNFQFNNVRVSQNTINYLNYNNYSNIFTNKFGQFENDVSKLIDDPTIKTKLLSGEFSTFSQLLLSLNPSDEYKEIINYLTGEGEINIPVDGVSNEQEQMILRSLEDVALTTSRNISNQIKKKLNLQGLPDDIFLIDNTNQSRIQDIPFNNYANKQKGVSVTDID